MAFGGDDGWKPAPADVVLYLGRPGAEEWNRAVLAVAEGTIVSTSVVGVPFKSAAKHDAFDKSLHDSEAYHRCPDGTYRTLRLTFYP